MQLSDFHFELPDALIARYPVEKRSHSKLMHITPTQISHLHFYHLIDLLTPGDLLIFNDTKVIPARLYGRKVTGGQVEILVERILDEKNMLAQLRVSKKPKIGDVIYLANEIPLIVKNKQNNFYELFYDNPQQTLLNLIETVGQIPLPPYMNRKAETLDAERYQTVYAKYKGSVAAPTAGLHFDNELITALKNKNIQLGYLTLHIGAGTFQPVRIANITQHTMHSEYLEINEELCALINKTKANGKRVIAVGTTSLRALETMAQTGKIQAYRGDTNIFIYPGFKFQCVDALITNLHLPASTLLMLVCAFGGYEQVMHAYETAVKHAYRFYSYGDAMWIDGIKF